MVATVTMFLGCQMSYINIYSNVSCSVPQHHLYTDKILEETGVKIFTCTQKIFATFLCDPWTRWTRRGVVSARAVTQLSLAGARAGQSTVRCRAQLRGESGYTGARRHGSRGPGAVLSFIRHLGYRTLLS